MFRVNTFLIAVLTLFFFKNIIPQTNYLREKRDSYIGVELNFPQYKKYTYGAKNGLAYNFNVKLKTRHSINLLFEVAYAKGGNDFWGEQFSRSDRDETWGNPLFGVEIESSDKMFYEFGLRIPAVNKKSWHAINVGSEIYFERPGAFNSEFVTIYGLANFIPFNTEITSMLLNIGSVIYFSKEGFGPYLTFTHSNKFSYKIEPISLYTGINLVVFLSGEGGSLAERLAGQFEVGISGKIMKIHPSLFFKTPFMGIGSDNGIIGFTIGYCFE